MYHYFIINPVAGRIDVENIKQILPEILSKDSYFCSYTRYVLHAEKLAYEACLKYNNIRIYSVGGDGTLNEVANGLLKSRNRNAVLIPVPMGSGNDFVRSIGYQEEADVKKLLLRAINCSTDEIDVCKANDRYFLNISSLGFDAQVVVNAIHYKKNRLIPKGLAYYLSVFTSFIAMKSYPVNITIDDKLPFSKRITLAALANGKYYGGGIIPAPEADLRDRLLDACIVDRVSRIKVPIFFPKYAKGKHGSIKEVNFVKCRKILIKCIEGKIILNVDGELSETNEVLFEVCENRIKVGLI